MKVKAPGVVSARDVLISTVGTSLLGNLARSPRPDLIRLLEVGNTKGLAVELLKMPPDDRLLGAEINSIQAILAGGRLSEPTQYRFLVSDTQQGRLQGDILKHYYQAAAHPRAAAVAVTVIEDLTDQDVARFRNQGLRNLVRLIVDDVEKYGAHRLLINATGGYKAQISFAGMIGQALLIPVCYLFETFSEIIELPPQPLAFDMGLWLEMSGLFYELEQGRITEREEKPPDERLFGLVETIAEQKRFLTSLSAMGQLFHETFRLKFQQQSAKLLPEDSGLEPNDKTIKYEDRNMGKHPGLAPHLERICTAPYVKRVFTHYYHPSLSRPNIFRPSAKGRPDHVEGWFSKAGALTKFDVVVTAQNQAQQQACIADLNERFGSAG